MEINLNILSAFGQVRRIYLVEFGATLHIQEELRKRIDANPLVNGDLFVFLLDKNEIKRESFLPDEELRQQNKFFFSFHQWW